MTVRTQDLALGRYWLKISSVGYETARQALRVHVIPHAPRDDVFAGYFATAFLTRIEQGEGGFLFLHLAEMQFLPEIVPTSIDGLAVESELADAQRARLL